MHAHDEDKDPLDPAMRPLVRAYVAATGTMGVHLDDAAKQFARKGYLDPIELVKRLPWKTSWELPLGESWERAASSVIIRARRLEHQKIRKDVPMADDPPLTEQEDMALEFLQDYRLKLVKDLSLANRKAITSVLNDAITEGWSIPKTVKAIKGSIGLRKDQVQAAKKRRALLEDKKWKPERIDAAVAKYEEKLLKYRAGMIARTETRRALNEGRLQQWTKMESEGLLPKGVQRVWILAPGACVICQEMASLNGVPLRSEFEGEVEGKSYAFRGPPAHPSCRCSTGLV